MNRGRTALGSVGIEQGGRDIARAVAALTQVGDDVSVAGALLFSGLAPLFSGDAEGGLRRLRPVRGAERGAGPGHVACPRTAASRPRPDHGGRRAGRPRGVAREGVPVVVASGTGSVSPSGSALVNLAVATDRPMALRLAGVLDEFADVNQECAAAAVAGTHRPEQPAVAPRQVRPRPACARRTALDGFRGGGRSPARADRDVWRQWVPHLPRGRPRSPGWWQAG